MISADLYILYGFLGFICLLQVAIVAILVRQSFVIGSLSGQLSGLTQRVGNLEGKVGNLEGKVDNLADKVENNSKLIAEVKGMLLVLNDRVNLLMGHRHDGVGRVVIIPEEMAAD